MPDKPYPYTIRLDDGRTLFVEIPARMVCRDRSGEVVFTLEGVRFLDRIRALATSDDAPLTPARIVTLREAAGLTQAELARRVGVNKLTVSRWERGAMRPSADSARALRRVIKHAKRHGVTLPS